MVEMATPEDLARLKRMETDGKRSKNVLLIGNLTGASINIPVAFAK